MSAQEHQMLIYLQLALVSQRKHQQSGRDKFLLLSAIAACREGFLDVAERCRELVLDNSPSHMLSQSDNFPSFLKNEEFVPFLRMLEKFCSFEKAEHLLDNMGIDASMPENVAESNVGEFALELLRGTDWGESEPSIP